MRHKQKGLTITKVAALVSFSSLMLAAVIGWLAPELLIQICIEAIGLVLVAGVAVAIFFGIVAMNRLMGNCCDLRSCFKSNCPAKH